MAISFVCSNLDCGKALSAPDTAAGKKVRCPQCGTITAIPAPAAAPIGSAFAVTPEPATAAKPARKKPRPDRTKTAAPGMGSQLVGIVVRVVMAAVAIGVVVGLIYSIVSLTRHTGQVVESEAKGVFGAKHAAEAVAAQNNLVLIRDAIRQLEAETDQYPATLQELVDKHMLSPGALRPSADAPEYSYIAGQTAESPEDNVLVYSDKPVQGLCEVLLRGGQLGTMTPEQLQRAIARTQSTIKAK